MVVATGNCQCDIFEHSFSIICGSRNKVGQQWQQQEIAEIANRNGKHFHYFVAAAAAASAINMLHAPA